ncbi:helix-turn-helix domain-containing protein [Streptomyces sp. NPDC049099]|uniref:helix-turn-helix domain-containing protein n=1 Tax=Streptomyces sp. NPDC049099 TaxID=3155768 RepID=UPI00341C823A
MASTTSPRWAPLPVGFGVMLRNARVDAGLSREALGAALLASAGTVQALEEEHRPPSVTIADRLARVLRLDPWRAAVLCAAAVDDAALRTRRGILHTRSRSPRHGAETRAITPVTQQVKARTPHT